MTVPTEQALELWHELMEHTPRGDAAPNLQPDGCKYVGQVALPVGVAAALRKVLSLDGFAELLARVTPDGWQPDGTEVAVRLVRGTPQLEADGMVLVAVQGTISRIPKHALMAAPRAAAGAFAEDVLTPLPIHRTEATTGVACSTCDGGGCPDCTDLA